MTTISIETLLQSGAHFGHLTFKWHPKMKPFLFGANKGVHVIDLRHTLERLKEAYEFANKIGSRGGRMMFVGTKPAAAEILKKYAIETENFYIVHRWLGGTLSNFATIRQSIQKLALIEEKAGPDLAYVGVLKKEAVVMEKERQKMQKMLGGIKDMRKMPAVIFIVDLNREKIALKESKIMGIPTIGVVDSNVNPTLVDYAIPSNDDSVKAIQMITAVIASGYMEGKAQFLQKGRFEEEDSKTDLAVGGEVEVEKVEEMI